MGGGENEQKGASEVQVSTGEELGNEKSRKKENGQHLCLKTETCVMDYSAQRLTTTASGDSPTGPSLSDARAARPPQMSSAPESILAQFQNSA